MFEKSQISIEFKVSIHLFSTIHVKILVIFVLSLILDFKYLTNLFFIEKKFVLLLLNLINEKRNALYRKASIINEFANS